VLSGCSLEFGGGRGATRQGRDIFGLWQGSVVVGLLVGGLVWGLIVFAVFRYRRRNDDLPNQTQYLIKLEILYTVVPVVIVAVLFAFSYRTQNEVDALDSDPAVTIDVKGFQWQWQFRYRDDDVTVTGLPGTEATMVLPEDRTTRLVLTSPDVIHSFYVPDFLFKRDVIPGVVNRFDLTPRDRGTYTGRCAEFCGLDHAKMTFEVRVVSMADFRTWIAEQQGAATGATS
jgi:cytochrome c oxidase subunit II